MRRENAVRFRTVRISKSFHASNNIYIGNLINKFLFGRFQIRRYIFFLQPLLVAFFKGFFKSFCKNCSVDVPVYVRGYVPVLFEATTSATAFIASVRGWNVNRSVNVSTNAMIFPDFFIFVFPFHVLLCCFYLFFLFCAGINCSSDTTSFFTFRIILYSKNVKSQCLHPFARQFSQLSTKI